MKQYPTISKKIVNTSKVYAFDKLDGSNIRAEWNKKKQAFYKFGSRKQLIDKNDVVLGESMQLIIEKYERSLSDVFNKNKFESVICFFEFFGPSSFAGQHKINEKRDVVLFDIAPYKKGIVVPEEFIALTDGLHIPNIVYEGDVTSDFVDSVKNGTLTGVTFEGVVCKSQVDVFKIKSAAWLEKLKEKCAGDEKLFEKLA